MVPVVPVYITWRISKTIMEHSDHVDHDWMAWKMRNSLSWTWSM